MGATRLDLNTEPAAILNRAAFITLELTNQKKGIRWIHWLGAQ